MSYIGQGLPADTFQGFVTDSFTGDGSATTFTLSKEPFSEDTLIVVINNVIQKPTTNFTVSGTTLTIVGTAVADGDVIYAIHMGGPLPIGGASELDLNGASDKLILDADADTTISADTDDQIDFKAGNADTMHIFNGDVRINTTTAIQPGSSSGLGVKGDINISDFTNDTSSSALVFTKSRNTTPGSQTIVNNDDQVGAIFFKADDGDASDYNNNVAAITASVDAAPGTNDTPGRLSFFTTADGERTNTERVRIHTGGVVSIPGGIELGSALDATTANTLDDYEEGTWTPANAQVSISVQSGIYVKVGELVFVQAYYNMPSTSDTTGHAVTGLPFTVKAEGFSYCATRVGGESSQIVVQLNGSATTGDFYKSDDTAPTNANLSGDYVLFSGCYRTA